MPDPLDRPASVTADWQPAGRRVDVPEGTTLLDAARAGGVDLVAVCGGAGTCESCRVRLVSGRLSPPTRVERDRLGDAELAAGYRLACQASIRADSTLHVPPESLSTPQRLQLEGQGAEVDVDPPVRTVEVELEPPTLEDLRSDFARLRDAVEKAGLGPPTARLSLLAVLPEALRQLGWAASVAVGESQVLGLLPRGRRALGLAADVGTTKLAAYLVDLGSGHLLGSTGRMNPQIALGEDVVSRIARADDEGRGGELREAVVRALDSMAAELCRQHERDVSDIVDAVLVGNTAMHHLALGLPVRQLGQAPYVPVIAAPVDVPAEVLGLHLAPGAIVHWPPNIAGYVGGDHVAMLLAAGLAEGAGEPAVALDIGTNTEITLRAGGRLWSCSCASGPAFEGAHISQGMRAAAGAIERVQLTADRVFVRTIGELPPIGICGSGILDAVAEMRRVGILDRYGALAPAHPAVRRLGRGSELVLLEAARTGHGRDITVTRADVNEIQLAKAAIRAGLDTLLERSGVTPAQIRRVVVAGAFGTYLDLDSALSIGMLPRFPGARYEQVGNAAGAGARRLLVSRASRRAAEALARRVEYVELTTAAGFADAFARAVCF